MIELAGHKLAGNTAVLVCDHVYRGSEVRTIHVDYDALCFQCGAMDDNIKLAKTMCLDEVIDRPGLDDVPFIPFDHVAHRESDGSWTVEKQAEEN